MQTHEIAMFSVYKIHCAFWAYFSLFPGRRSYCSCWNHIKNQSNEQKKKKKKQRKILFAKIIFIFQPFFLPPNHRMFNVQGVCIIWIIDKLYDFATEALCSSVFLQASSNITFIVWFSRPNVNALDTRVLWVLFRKTKPQLNKNHESNYILLGSLVICDIHAYTSIC